MITFWKLVERVQGTRSTILKNGIILSQITSDSLFIRVFLNNGITWDKKIQTKHYPFFISEGDNTVNICYDNDLDILDSITGEILARFETDLIHLGNSFFIRFEREGEIGGTVKMFCYYFDRAEIKFMWSLNAVKRGYIEIHKNILHINNDTELKIYSLSNGERLWQLNYKEFYPLGKGSRTTGVVAYKNMFFVPLVNVGVICVDIETGQVIHQIQEMGYIIALYKDKIYSVWNNIVSVLNTSNFSVEKIDFSATLLPFGLEMDRVKFVINENNFYFIHQKEVAIVGVLDLKTKQLLWQTTIEIEKGSYWIADLQVHQNRLYVLTQGGTLHIFEREE